MIKRVLKIEVKIKAPRDTSPITFVAPSKSLGINDQATLRSYPNPFYSSTSIEIDNPEGLEARLDIYNVQGQRVSTKYFESGNKVLTFTWDAKDNSGKTINNGLYFVHFESSRGCRAGFG